ncbi:YfhE family protein [Sporosarcina sp. 179-K 3D1 HS]
MAEKKEPHKQLTKKNNGSSSTQEVLYASEFKKADKAAYQDTNNRNHQK